MKDYTVVRTMKIVETDVVVDNHLSNAHEYYRNDIYNSGAVKS